MRWGLAHGAHFGQSFNATIPAKLRARFACALGATSAIGLWTTANQTSRRIVNANLGAWRQFKAFVQDKTGGTDVSFFVTLIEYAKKFLCVTG